MLLSPAHADDTPVPSGWSLTLAEANERVQRLSPQRRAAQARHEAATGALLQARQWPNPSLDLREENLNLNSGRHAAVDQTVDVFAVISQPLEIAGKRPARRAIATAEVDIALATIRDTERTLTLETTRVYLTALRAARVSAVLADNRRGLQTLVDTLARRVQEGYAAEADLMKLRAEAARTETDLARVRIDFLRNAVALQTLLMLPAPLSETQLVTPSPIDPPPGDPETLAQQVVTRRPAIVIARARLERAQRALELERARRIPDFAFVAGYKRTAGEDTLVTGVVIPLPLFDRNTGNIARADAEARAAALDLDTLTQQVTAESIALIAAAQQLATRARLSTSALLQPAEIARNAARSAFREGAANMLQLVDAERVYTDAQRTMLELQLDAYSAAFEANLVVHEQEDR